MPQRSYPYAVGRIRVQELRFLDKSKWTRLFELDENDALKYLVEIGYGANAQTNQLDSLIKAELSAARSLIKDITPDEPLTDLLLLPTDAHNLKTLFKSRLSGTSQDELLLDGGCFSAELLKRSVGEGDYTFLPQYLASGLKAIDQQLQKDLLDSQQLSAAVDTLIFRIILDTLKNRRNAYLTKYFTALIDFTNALSVIRAKMLGMAAHRLQLLLLEGGSVSMHTLTEAMDAPEGALRGKLGLGKYSDELGAAVDSYQTSGLIAIEKIMDRELVKLIRAEETDAFGIGPIVSYLLKKESEAKSLRVLFAAKRAGNSVPLSELGVMTA